MISICLLLLLLVYILLGEDEKSPAISGRRK
jgi:hypothetical protein